MSADVGLGLLGQGSEWARLIAQARALRAPHGVILVGPRGSGKTLATRVLSAALLCESAASEPCGACAACTKVAAGTHPDVHAVTVPDDKQEIPVEAVRGLRDTLSRHAVEGRARVACIDPADRLNEQGQNALLKTLEEPGRSTFLLLAATRPESLLPTVRSRAVTVRLRTLGEEDLLAGLERLGVGSPDGRRWAARTAGGSLGLARDLLEEQLDAVQQQVVALIEGRDDMSPIDCAREFLSGAVGRVEADRRARLVLHVARSVLRGHIYGRLASASDPQYGAAQCDAWIEHLEAACEAETDLDLKIGAERALSAFFLRFR